MSRHCSILAVLAASLALAGCGSSSSSSSAGASSATTSAGSSAASAVPDLTISAATSLKNAFTTYGSKFTLAHARFSFGGSDILAAQIEQGAKPDVFASANTALPQKLYAKGLLEKPVTFAANKLVLAVPASSTKVRSLSDVEKAGVTVAIGSATVPIGTYTRKVLAKLPPEETKQILGNVRSDEPDVGGIVGKLSEGAVDAGFTYATDVNATHGKLTAIPLPAALQPVVAYGVAVVKGAPHPVQAEQFITGLLHGEGSAALLADGFLSPPHT
jgi:molybdate transport system substrate-binding protein